jgi:hypothetical protein
MHAQKCSGFVEIESLHKMGNVAVLPFGVFIVATSLKPWQFPQPLERLPLLATINIAGNTLTMLATPRLALP